MSYEVVLIVDGVELSSDGTRQAIESNGLADNIVWASVDGLVQASVWVEDLNPVFAVCDAAHKIENHVSGARVARVHDDLVSISDIADRVGMSREIVRLWAAGDRGPGGFPQPRGAVGGSGARGAMRVWAWRDAVLWLQTNYRLFLDEPQLTEAQIADINQHLTRHGRTHEVANFMRSAAQQVIAAAPSAGNGVFNVRPISVRTWHHVLPADTDEAGAALSDDQPAAWAYA